MFYKKRIVGYIGVFLLSACFLTLTGCKKENRSHYFSRELEISLPSDADITYTDNHGGFHGDGSAIGTVYLDEISAVAIVEEMKENKHWNQLPLTEDIALIMYGGIRNNRVYGHNLAEEVGIPEVINGYWMIIDRFDNQNRVYSDKDILGRYSFNFTVGIFDMDESILYYYEFDS